MFLSSLHKVKYGNWDFTLRCLTERDVSETYVGWLNDSYNRRFLILSAFEKGKTISVREQANYVSETNDSRDRLLLGFFVNDSLVGTAGVQHVGHPDKHPSLGVLIGDTRFRGKGLGKIWVGVSSAIVFAKYTPRKISAAAIGPNESSIISFQRAGYLVEGVIRDAVRHDYYGWVDSILLGCFRSELVPLTDMGASEFSDA